MKVIFQKINQVLDGTAMYRTVTLALSFLAVYALGLGFWHVIPYRFSEQVISLAVALTVALITNYLASRLWKVAVNMESAVIMALIIHFLIIPIQITKLENLWVIAAVVFLAVASKFIIAWRKQHIVNPAAFGAVALALVYAVFPVPGYFESNWWIGQVEFFIPLLIAGGVVVLKVRKWTLVLSFLVVACLVFVFEEWRFSGEPLSRFSYFWLSGPSVFLAFFMLTEPFTTPPRKRLQGLYGAFVGIISQTTLFLPLGIKMTPELAVVLGNLAFYPFTLRRKLYLKLQAIREVAKNTYEFVFIKPVGINFKAGQYLEWMLPHAGADSRGVRRYFTIASSPLENNLRIGVRFGEKVSSYKTALLAMKPGETIIASQLSGDFTLPADTHKKIACVAGGIGITPFISHISQMELSKMCNNTVLFYCNNTLAEVAYRDRLQASQLIVPLKVINILANEDITGCETGFLTAELIKKHAPDYLERRWYLSGPPGMVDAYAKLLRELGVPRREIKKDFFPGLL